MRNSNVQFPPFVVGIFMFLLLVINIWGTKHTKPSVVEMQDSFVLGISSPQIRPVNYVTFPLLGGFGMALITEQNCLITADIVPVLITGRS